MDKVPWVGNGWVQLPWVGNGSGLGTVVKPNAGLCCIWRSIYMKGCLIQSCTHRWKHLVYPLVRLTNHQLIAETI
jgi:hypothetical protein